MDCIFHIIAPCSELLTHFVRNLSIFETEISGAENPPKRLARRCPYCGKTNTNLTRHLRDQHKQKPEVSAILDGSVTKLQARRGFAKIKNLGILQRNKEMSTDSDKPVFETIKKGSTALKVVHFTKCNGSYPQKYFGRHKIACKDTDEADPKSVHITLVEADESTDFLDILNRFHNNDVGNICRTDKTVKLIGRHLWQKDKTKVDKHDEVRKSVMANLANLYLNFKSCLEGQECNDAADMCDRDNWKELKQLSM